MCGYLLVESETVAKLAGTSVPSVAIRWGRLERLEFGAISKAPWGLVMRQGERGRGGRRLHPVKAEACAAVPDRGGGTAHRVSIGAEAAAGGADQGDREVGSYEATHFEIRPLPFGRPPCLASRPPRTRGE